MNKIKGPTLVFDTNIFKRVSRIENEALYRTFFKDLVTRIEPDSKFGVPAIVTPFLLFEYLGMNIDFPKFDTFPDDVKKSGNPAKISNFVREFAERHFKSLPEMKVEFLQTRLEDQMKYVSGDARKLFEDLIKRLLQSQGSVDVLIQNLALDYTYGFSYESYFPKELVQHIHVRFMFDIYLAFSRKANVSQARAIFHVIERMAIDNKDGFTDEMKKMAQVKKGLKSKGDLADLDIIQLAVIGGFIGDNKDLRPVLAITSDPKDDVLLRLQAFKTLITHLKSNLESLKEFESQRELLKLSLAEGYVAICNSKTCTIDEIISVADIKIIN